MRAILLIAHSLILASLSTSLAGCLNEQSREWELPSSPGEFAGIKWGSSSSTAGEILGAATQDLRIEVLPHQTFRQLCFRHGTLSIKGSRNSYPLDSIGLFFVDDDSFQAVELALQVDSNEDFIAKYEALKKDISKVLGEPMSDIFNAPRNIDSARIRFNAGKAGVEADWVVDSTFTRVRTGSLNIFGPRTISLRVHDQPIENLRKYYHR